MAKLPAGVSGAVEESWVPPGQPRRAGIRRGLQEEVSPSLIVDNEWVGHRQGSLRGLVRTEAREGRGHTGRGHGSFVVPGVESAFYPEAKLGRAVSPVDF